MTSAHVSANADHQPCRRDSFYHRPLIPLLFSFMAGIIPARYIDFSPWICLLAWAVFTAAALRIVFLLSKNRSSVLSPLVLFCALGFLALSPWQKPFFPPGQAGSYLDSGYYMISGTVARPPEVESYRTKCILGDLEVTEKSGCKNVLPGLIQAAFYGDCPEFYPGERVMVRARLRGFKNFNNPGGFDYRRYMADRNIWGALYAGNRYVEKKPETHAMTGAGFAVHSFRNGLDGLIWKVNSGDTAAVLSALVIGKRNGIGPDLREAFNRAGASHLLAISGLHVGIIAACSFFLFKWILSFSTTLLLTGRASRAAALLAVLPVVAYALLSGLSPSTQRAAIMVTVFLAALIKEKQYNPANTLAAAALCILAVYPPGLFSISFQLSFAAVSSIFFGIYIFSETAVFKTAPPSSRVASKILKRAAGFIMISVFAIVGTMPLVMHYFNQASIMGIFSNLILIPWIGFAAVPAGLIGALASLFSQTAGAWCLNAAGLILEPAILLIYQIARVPFAAFNTVTPSALEVICVYAGMICLGLLFSRRHKTRRRLPAAFLCLVLVIAAIDAGYWIHKRFLHRDLKVTVLDVGQGHASFLEFPGRHTMLIDGGGFTDNSVFDVGAFIVAPYLRQNKVVSIDTVVLSHPDTDHLNGLLYILEHFRVRRVITTHESADTGAYSRFLQIIEERKIDHPEFGKAARKRFVNGVETEVIHPEPTGPEMSCSKCSGANNCSIVLRVSYGDKSILFPGDIEKCAESLLISAAGQQISSDILIAPHHGSKSSSSPAFLEAVSPDTVIVPVRKSRLGLPSPAVLRSYKKMGFRILRTDVNGAVSIHVRKDGQMEIRPQIGTSRTSK